MGLDIAVGVLTELRTEDAEGYAFHKEQLDIVNQVLVRAGLPEHREPEDAEPWGAQMFSYSGLHYLRRVAAHLELRGRVPPPGNEQASKDPVLDEYGDLATGTARGIRRLFGKARPRRMGFDHLILHSDAEGYYVPIDFEGVLFGDEAHPLLGGMLGSSQRLVRECERLRDALDIPADLDPEAELLWYAPEGQGAGAGWQRHGVEAFTCVRLLHGARLSVERRAALVFQ